MNSYIQKLQEARTIDDANVILNKLHANGAIRKLVEASFLMRDTPNTQTQNYGMTLLNEAVTTLKDSEQPDTPESPGLKTKGDHFVKEEELDNHNPTQRAAGSEQSTSNTGLPMEGKSEGDEDMQNAPDTENQMTEMEDHDGLNILENAGLHPDIANKMGSQMPKIPPMDSGDQMKQMKYTVHEAMKPLIKHIRIQDKHIRTQDNAIKELSKQIRETKSMSLDFSGVKDNSIASFRETTGGMMNSQPNFNQQVTNKEFEKNEQRSRMIQLNDALAAQLT